ncbi:MAG: phosphoserine transaminase [Planctomycetes bacterium]|nr:phosphoserine transaminase [Planctomycetota bacterium]
MALKRVYNFSPGPSPLPLEILKEAQEDLLNYQDSGLSVMEMSHRSPEYSGIHQGAKDSLRKVLSIPEDFEIIFVGGGASTQFYVAPLNLLGKNDTADFINTGTWSKNAIKEAKRVANVHVAASGENDKFMKLPETFNFSNNAKYVHLVTNNTIYGTQWASFPDTNGKPLVVDMSSDIASYPVDFSNVCLMFAGAQKNLGCAGVTVVILRKDLKLQDDVPTMLSYKTHINKDSLFNTPPCFNIYMLKLYMEWVLKLGGVNEMKRRADMKAAMLYDIIDEYADFYAPLVHKDSRSKMNIVFKLPNEELEKEFSNEAKIIGFVGLKGHRSVGGMRASLYNAVEIAAVDKLIAFMRDFRKRH